jgi:hypothetical protein
MNLTKQEEKTLQKLVQKLASANTKSFTYKIPIVSQEIKGEILGLPVLTLPKFKMAKIIIDSSPFIEFPVCKVSPKLKFGGKKRKGIKPTIKIKKIK